jgi:hypothetical protein
MRADPRHRPAWLQSDGPASTVCVAPKPIPGAADRPSLASGLRGRCCHHRHSGPRVDIYGDVFADTDYWFLSWVFRFAELGLIACALFHSVIGKRIVLFVRLLTRIVGPSTAHLLDRHVRGRRDHAPGDLGRPGGAGRATRPRDAIVVEGGFRGTGTTRRDWHHTRGRMFKVSSNAYALTGNGHAIAYRHGLPLEDMEFFQFHPTGIYRLGILLCEACHGDGGIMFNKDGERFMERYAGAMESWSSRG